MLEPILIIGLVVALTAWFVQHKWRKRLRALAKRDAALRNSVQDPTGLEVLARRYARGEIGRDEYLEKRDDILATAADPESRI